MYNLGQKLEVYNKQIDKLNICNCHGLINAPVPRVSDTKCNLRKMVKEVAAITGGTTGLGQGFVERFVRDGYEVCLSMLFFIKSLLLPRSSSVGVIQRQAPESLRTISVRLSRPM